MDRDKVTRLAMIINSAMEDVGTVVWHSVYGSYLPELRLPENIERRYLELAKKKLEVALSLV